MNSRALPLLLMLAGCGAAPTPAARPPLEGARIGGPFALIDQDGRAVTDRSFAGRWRIMYFGYTFCPDVCPLDAAAIGGGLKAFALRDAAAAAKVLPIFVTVDPARDTPAVLKTYVAAFHPRMVGLTGSTAAIDATKKAFGIYAAAAKPDADGNYLVSHSRTAYLMDPEGRPIALLPTEAGPDKVADELQRWVH